jgi:hypothetical protein
MSDYIPPEPSSRDKVLHRVQGGRWVASGYDNGLVLTDRPEHEDGVLGVADYDGGPVTEWIDGRAHDTGVIVTIAITTESASIRTEDGS